MTAEDEHVFLDAKHMNAMERCRRLLRDLLDDRTPGGKIKQKTFARHMDKSEAWLSNILSGKRGLRIVDLDKLAEFFRLPISEFVREDDAELIEATPSEKALLRRLRRTSQDYSDAVLKIAGMAPPHVNRTAGPETRHDRKRK